MSTSKTVLSLAEQKENMMNEDKRNELTGIMNQVEEMWAHLDTLFGSLASDNGWERAHGQDWTLADVPYHLAYCNRDVVARGLALGPDYPEGEQKLLDSLEAISEWNKRKFAERPAGQTAEESVAQWRESCEEIRSITAGMTDRDLERSCWYPMWIGWATARHLLLNFCLVHDYGEFMQLRIHMGRREPVPSPTITSTYLGAMLQMLPMFLNQEAAAGKEFTVVHEFTDRDVGTYTLRVADGQAAVTRGRAEDPDLVLTQSSETWEKTLRGIQSPAEAIESGDIGVSDFEALAMFGQLFPM